MANPLDLEVRDFVRHFHDAFDRIAVEAILAHGHRRPTPQHGAAAGAIAIPGWSAIRVEYG